MFTNRETDLLEFPYDWNLFFMFGCQDEANAVAETPLDHAIHGGVSEPVLNHALRMQILSLDANPLRKRYLPSLSGFTAWSFFGSSTIRAIKPYQQHQH